MLKSSAHDGLPVLNCPNRWPLLKKHSGSDSSVCRTDPASIVFDSWTIPDVEEKPARYQSVKDIWWTPVWAERGIRQRARSVTSAPSPPTFHQPPMETVSTLTRPDLERVLHFFPLAMLRNVVSRLTVQENLCLPDQGEDALSQWWCHGFVMSDTCDHVLLFSLIFIKVL